MKSIKSLFPCLVALLLIVAACKTPKNNNETKSSAQKSDTASSYPDQSGKVKSSFKVSFISPGSGIDYKTKEKYDEYLKNFEEKNKITLSKEVLRIGKEGETVYCFDLSDMDPNKQKKFISESKEILESSMIIHVEENVICH